MRKAGYLSDLLENNGIAPENVVLIRHAMSDKGFKTCYENGFIKLYTQIQGKRSVMLKERKIWMVFIGFEGKTAVLYRIYKQTGFSDIRKHKCPERFPYPENFEENLYLYDLEETELLKGLDITIDWGESTRSWYQSATIPKPIIKR